MTQFIAVITHSSGSFLFIRVFNTATRKERHHIFDLVSRVIGCDDSEIASLAIDLCPNDWRAFFSMAKFRQPCAPTLRFNVDCLFEFGVGLPIVANIHEAVAID